MVSVCVYVLCSECTHERERGRAIVIKIVEWVDMMKYRGRFTTAT